jgi:copper(I)-binding protein
MIIFLFNFNWKEKQVLFLIIAFIAFFSSSNITAGEKIDIKDAWLRTGAEGLNSALYFKIENKSEKPDTLYKVSSDIAEHVMMHETYKKNDMMGMREIKNLVIKPNSTVEFKPGSYHVMLMNLIKDIKNGDELNFTLYFKSAGEINIKAIVRTN